MTVVNSQYRQLNASGATAREISEVVNNLVNGKTNNTGYFSTTAATTTTAIYNERIGSDSAIIFTPMDDKAASEMAKLYVLSRTQGAAIISHDSNAHVCNFMYIVVG
jgi:hypothetical protein